MSFFEDEDTIIQNISGLSTNLFKSHHDIYKKNILKNFGMEYCYSAMKSGKYGFPLLKAFKGETPKHFIPLCNLISCPLSKSCLVGFEYDYILDRMWYNLDAFLKKIQNYYCMSNPDYSLYVDSPLAVQIANKYRSHVVAYAVQESGIPILPSIPWSTPSSYEFCFSGYSRGGKVIISTIGTLRNELSRMYFKSGFDEMIRKISPDLVILYGDVNDELLSWMPKELTLEFVKPLKFERARKNGD